MGDPRTTREIAISNEKRIDAALDELERVKARLRLLETQAGWDSDALEFPAEDVRGT